MSYIISTETSPVQEYKERDSKEVWDEVSKALLSVGLAPINPTKHCTPMPPNYKIFRISDETYDFIQNVAKTTHDKFGEKVYIINDLKFTIWAEEDYEKQFGKSQE
jgi:hypothetical protein